MVDKKKSEDTEEVIISEEAIEADEKLKAEDSAKMSEALSSIKVDASDIILTKVDKKKLEDANELADLYAEFNDFIEVKGEMKAEVGKKMTVSTGIDVLDAMLGGGFPVGALSIVVGNPGSGKSMLTIQTMGAAQREHKGCLTSFLDSEEATTSQRLANLGVNKPKINPYTDITVEKVFKHLEVMCLFKEKKGITDIPSILCWDSIANTSSQREREVEDLNQAIGFKARLLSFLIPKYIAKCSKYNIAFLAVNQMREQLAMGQFAPAKELRFLSAGKSLPGGQSLKFNAFVLLEMKAKGVLDPAKYGFDGILVSVTSVKNKLMPPNMTVELIGDFVRGFNNIRTNFHFLVKHKRLTSGAWNYLVSYPEKKFRTKDLETLCKEDPIFKEKFDIAVKECIQTEIIDPTLVEPVS
jgi:RecA/RadA recombinase